MLCVCKFEESLRARLLVSMQLSHQPAVMAPQASLNTLHLV